MLVWIFTGCFADYSFPYGQAVELLLACFRGTVSAKVNNLQQQLQRTEVVAQSDNQKQVQKLNNLESQAWLYEGILDRFGEDPSTNHEKIARTIEALELKRKELLQELEPRKPQRYRILSSIQNYTRFLLASQAEKDYIKLEKIVNNIVVFARNRQPSQIILSEVIEITAMEIAQNANQISPYRLRLAYRIDDLLRVLSAKLVLKSGDSKTDDTDQALINELRSRINLLSEQFDSLLRSRQENTNKLSNRIEEIHSLTKNTCDLYREIFERDADIAALQKNVEDSTKLVRTKQTQINDLQSQISQLDKQNLELQQGIRDSVKSSQGNQSQIEKLKNEKFQSNNQKLELEQLYQTLLQQYQQQEDEVSDLRTQIKNLSQIKQAKFLDPNSILSRELVERVGTSSVITVEDYEAISNKSDYVFVEAYSRRDGTPVKAHYRRRPSR